MNCRNRPGRERRRVSHVRPGHVRAAVAAVRESDVVAVEGRRRTRIRVAGLEELRHGSGATATVFTIVFTSEPGRALERERCCRAARSCRRGRGRRCRASRSSGLTSTQGNHWSPAPVSTSHGPVQLLPRVVRDHQEHVGVGDRVVYVVGAVAVVGEGQVEPVVRRPGWRRCCRRPSDPNLVAGQRLAAVDVDRVVARAVLQPDDEARASTSSRRRPST